MMAPRKSRLRSGWDAAKLPVIIGAGLALLQQGVSIRGELQRQEQAAAASATTQVALLRDVARLNGKVFGNLDPRVSRLERPAKRVTLARAGHAGPDSSSRSPGLFKKAVNLISAPGKALLGLFQGGDKK